jgi:hypothetical protein
VANLAGTSVKMLAFMLAFSLAGCAASFQVPPAPAPTPIVEAPRALCLVRARLFRGLVAVPCSDLAQEFKP